MTGTIVTTIRYLRAHVPSGRRFAGWWILPFAVSGVLFWVWMIRLLLRLFGQP
ncbi:hypothetical protein [Sagittula stellata]|uniref:Uncharacterized protein n=1 Tax=Sagittula stellata (strain ATCC 700073 / DSM 11524 / E-37) TaxID=388399 RepID=A3K1N3_SAGS3|nr:hypothetical protein [Sagittula stellata]EBA08829.1 hypothetical protein SSE37_04265 [Sagittula stellata E-37]